MNGCKVCGRVPMSVFVLTQVEHMLEIYPHIALHSRAKQRKV